MTKDHFYEPQAGLPPDLRDKIAAGTEKSITSPPAPETDEGGASLPDFIYGAAGIARFLGITVRKVYHLTEMRRHGKGQTPIHNLPHIGLCASRKALIDYMNGQRQV